MLRNYLKSAFRNLSRNGTYSFLNIAGLVVGFSTFFLIFVVLQYERSFDQFHDGKDRIYRVIREDVGPTGGLDYHTGVPFPVTQTLRLDYPQLDGVAAIYGDNDVQVIVPAVSGGAVKKFMEKSDVFFAEPQFFQLFRFKLLDGDPVSAIAEPNTALVTKDIAIKYFEDWGSAPGKVIKVDGLNIKITGVLDNPPANTDFPLGIVISYVTLDGLNNWNNISDNNYCFVRLSAGFPQQRLLSLLPDFTSKHIGQGEYRLRLQPLREMHFDDRLGNFNDRTFSKDLITTLSLIGIFILVIACLNFINLATAQAMHRSREVGVRKVLGGTRNQLFVQFIGEAGAICVVGFVVSIGLSLLMISFINKLLEIKISFDFLENPVNILFALGVLVTVTAFSGIYPALVLAGFNPIKAIKNVVVRESGSRISVRKILVSFQFIIAQALIFVTLVAIAQMDYFRNADLGFNKEAIITADFPNNDSLNRSKVGMLRNQLLQDPAIEEVSFSHSPPTQMGGLHTDFRLGSNHTSKMDFAVNAKIADTAFFGIYKFKIVAGRVYFPADTTREYVVNEALVRKAGYGSPERAIGQLITVSGKTGSIVGVVKDFHVNSLRDPIEETVMMARKRSYDMANIKINPSKMQQAIGTIEAVWNKTYPDFVLEYSFIDQRVANFYKQENQISQLYKLFAGIAILISCLGLYGMVSYMTLRRYKEIAIRKVLGAPAGNIVYLLTREFTVLLLIAFVVAAPIGSYFMHQWLQQYSFRVDLNYYFFIEAFFISIGVAWLTVGYSTLKAALAKPAASLKVE
jgi:putative ABC transport system permease protein